MTEGARPEAAAWSVAYVMTHYPRVALTFIAGEVDEIERAGGCVVPIAMNTPVPEDVRTEEAQVRQRRSVYLKAMPLRIAAATIAAFAAHPFAMTRLSLKALKSARFDLRLMVRRLVHLAYAASTARYCRGQSVHHLHAHFGQSPATIAWFASEIMNQGRPGSCTWSFTIHGFQDFVDETEARLDLKAASAAFVACISDFTRSQLCRVADAVYWDRFKVVRCGIDLSLFAFRGAAPLRRKPRILILGRLSPEKGHLSLLRALRIAADSGIDTELEIVGSGPFEGRIRYEAELLGLSETTTFLGELLPEEVFSRLREADIFCMASFAEGIPVSMMEAMAVGVPVVSTWVCGIPELAENEVTALTVPPGNSASMAEAIMRLVSDPVLRENLVVAARARVEQLHSRAKNTSQLESLFRTQTNGNDA